MCTFYAIGLFSGILHEVLDFFDGSWHVRHQLYAGRCDDDVVLNANAPGPSKSVDDFLDQKLRLFLIRKSSIQKL